MLGLLYYKSVNPIMNGGGPGAGGQQPPEKREGGPSPPPKKRRIICSSVPSMVGMQKKDSILVGSLSFVQGSLSIALKSWKSAVSTGKMHIAIKISSYLRYQRSILKK